VVFDDAAFGEKKAEEKKVEEEKVKEKEKGNADDFFNEEVDPVDSSEALQQEKPIAAPKKANLTTKSGAATKAKPGAKKLGAVKASDMSFEEMEKQAKEEQLAKEKLLQQGIITQADSPGR